MLTKFFFSFTFFLIIFFLIIFFFKAILLFLFVLLLILIFTLLFIICFFVYNFLLYVLLLNIILSLFKLRFDSSWLYLLFGFCKNFFFKLKGFSDFITKFLFILMIIFFPSFFAGGGEGVDILPFFSISRALLYILSKYFP